MNLNESIWVVSFNNHMWGFANKLYIVYMILFNDCSCFRNVRRNLDPQKAASHLVADIDGHTRILGNFRAMT